MPEPRPRRVHPLVMAIVAAVALFDLATGAILLLDPLPTWAHGRGTLWTELDPLLVDHGPWRPHIMSLLRRIGAFQTFTGAATLIWLTHGIRHNPRAITVLLLTYLTLGGLFFLTDRTYFAGTSYLLLKQLIGTAWLAATALHLWHQRPPTPAPN